MSNNSNDYAKLIGMQMTPVQMVDTITALRAEVEEERAHAQQQRDAGTMHFNQAMKNGAEANRLRAEVVEARYLHGEAVRMSKSLAAELADARSQLSARDAEVRALREVLQHIRSERRKLTRVFLNTLYRTFGLLDLDNNPTPLLTSEPGPGGSNDQA